MRFKLLPLILLISVPEISYAEPKRIICKEEFGSGAWRHQQPDWLLEWPTDNLHYVTDIDTPEDLRRWAQ